MSCESMSAYPYFEGEREVDKFGIKSHHGEVIINCRIAARWERIMAYSLRCGEEYVFEMTRRHGVRQEERESLSAMVKASFGVSDIANGSAVKGTASSPLAFEDFSESKRGASINGEVVAL